MVPQMPTIAEVCRVSNGQCGAVQPRRGHQTNGGICFVPMNHLLISSEARRTTAFTLLEMLLVLAVLTAALAVLYPATERLYRTHRFQQALEEVRGKLAATRVRAIDDGLIYEFRYEPQGRRLLVIPQGQQPAATKREEVPGNPAQHRPGPWCYAGELPAGVRFGSQEHSGEGIPAERLTTFPDAAELALVSWSAPVLFFPDGSATDAEIPVRGMDGLERRISVRGLTGASSVIATDR